MNDFSLITGLFDTYSKDIQSNSKLLITVIIFISINLIITLINIYAQVSLKEKEKKIFSFNLKEKKRIEVFEVLFVKLDLLTFFDGKVNNANFLIDIQNIDKYVTSQRLYIPNALFKVVQEYNDYYKSVLSDYRKKNYATEIDLSNKLCLIFNS